MRTVVGISLYVLVTMRDHPSTMRASGGNNDATTVPDDTPEPVMGVIVLPETASTRRRAAGPHAPRTEGTGRAEELGRFRELLQILPDAYLYTDVEGRILELNPAAEGLLGMEMAGEAQQLLDLVHPDDRAAVEHLLRSASMPTTQEARFRSAEGRGFVAEVRVSPEVRRRRRVGLVWLVRKVRDDVGVQDLSGDVLCQLPVLAYASDGNGRWEPQFVSPRLAELLGCSPEELGEAPGQWDEQIHPDDLERVVDGRQRVCRDRVPVKLDYRVLTRHGLVRWVRDEMRPHSTADAAIRGVVVDLSDLARDPQARTDVRRRGVDEDSAPADGRAHDNANKRTFLRLFLHDVRSPLAVAVAIVESLLREEGDLPADQRRSLLSRAVTNLAQIHHLLSEVLDIERLEQRRVVVRREATDVSAVVASVVAEMPENDHVISFEGTAQTVHTDPALVARAVRKLLENALTHTPLETCVWVTVRDDADGLLLSVEDDGVGVPDGLKERIFEAFERGTAPSTTAGFGLGLALVRHIAELLGGRAWVEDRPGGGAAFRLRLAR